MGCSICKLTKHNKKTCLENKAKTPKIGEKKSPTYLENEILVLHLFVPKIISMMEGSKSSISS